tara:strand:- start:541 stop:2301 length:1761 start_codon:yes stop_codon:yes gene_type:complete
MREFWDRCKHDRRFYFESCLRIRAIQDGKYVLKPLILNAEQEQILQAIEEQEADKKPVRLIILKSRKVGCSTLIEALGHHYCQFNRHVNAKCIAHLKESTRAIFDITKRYQQNLPSMYETAAPGTIKGHAIQWKHGSKFSIETQGATDAARGQTPDFVHLSELALWWKRRRSTSDEDVLQAQMGSIEDSPGTYVIIESTAHGAAGAFYNRFWSAYKDAPGNMFKALFFGWQEHHKYRLPEQHGEKAQHDRLMKASKAGDDELFWEMTEQLGYDTIWAKRAVEFDLKPCQVKWAQQTLQTKFGGDITRFDTEYPLTPQIAFTSSASSPFDQGAVLARINEIKEANPKVRRGSLFKGNGVLEPGNDDWLIWHPPDSLHDYIVSIDSAHGVEDGDFSCIQVLDRTTREQVAEYYARVPPDVVAQQAALAGRAYNSALVVPEVDGPGLAVVKELLDLNDGDGYTNLYVRSYQGNWSQRFGFRTGSTGKRDAALASLAKAIRLGSWTFNSLRFLKECQTFIENQRGRYEAMTNEHDDAVMAMAISIYLDSELDDASLSEPELTKAYNPDAVANYINTEDYDRDPHLGKWWS